MSAHGLSIELLNAISQSTSSHYSRCLLNEKGSEELTKCISLLKEDSKRNRPILIQWIQAKGCTPPLEMLWRLNEDEIMFVTTYFYMYPDELDALLELFETIYSNVDSSTHRVSASNVLASIIATLINTVTNHDEKMQTICKGAVERIVKVVCIMGIRLMEEGVMQGCYLTDILNSVYIFQECLTQFLFLHLREILSYTVPKVSHDIVIATHVAKWSCKNMGVETNFFISKILESLTLDSILDELKIAATVLPCHWKSFLTVLAVLVSENENSAQPIKGFIDEWFRLGLEENNKELLYLAIIAVRHCCNEKPRNFPTYISWFGAINLTNPSHFVKFFDFLTQLVPNEPPLYLKIHINKVPTAPSGCQNIVSEYTMLAKTRLADLNETTDYLSIFNECHNTNEESLSSDVAHLIRHYTATSEIAKPVVEASIFRKQYYEKCFLKYLLSISSREDLERAKVIRKMNSSGMIPVEMYSSWLRL